MAASKRAKKSGGRLRARRRRREPALPVIEVDVDDEAALGAIAEQMAPVIVAAVAEKARWSAAKKTPGKRKRATKSR